MTRWIATLWLAMLSLAGCGAPAGAAHPSFATRAGAHSAGAREAHLLGVSEEAIPELAPLWPALSARAATEVVESLSVAEGAAVHCLSVMVAGDLAQEALEAWREGARGSTCEGEPSDVRCRRDATALRITAGEALDEDVATLDAIAAEMGMPPEPSAMVVACVEGLSLSRLSRIDERLHVDGLLEPWHELHERLGARRFAELRWTRSASRGTELAVRYRADEEALELASEWARAAGLAADDGAWRWIDAAMRLALELRPGPSPSIELLLVREP